MGHHTSEKDLPRKNVEMNGKIKRLNKDFPSLLGACRCFKELIVQFRKFYVALAVFYLIVSIVSCFIGYFS